MACQDRTFFRLNLRSILWRALRVEFFIADAANQEGKTFLGSDTYTTSGSRLRMDLLTAVMHELSHTLGRADQHDHGTESDLMYETLAAGVRRTTSSADLDVVWGSY